MLGLVYTRNVELFRASGLTLSSSSDTIAANTINQVTGKTGAIDLAAVANGLLAVTVTGVSGTTPGLAVFVDVQDAFGNWCLVSNATAISGAVLNTAGTTYGQISNGYNLTHSGRIRWTLTGTSPSFTGVSLSMYGR